EARTLPRQVALEVHPAGDPAHESAPCQRWQIRSLRLPQDTYTSSAGSTDGHETYGRRRSATSVPGARPKPSGTVAGTARPSGLLPLAARGRCQPAVQLCRHRVDGAGELG